MEKLLLATRGKVFTADHPHEEHKWWSHDGAHPNWIIDNASEPISGQQRWMDTVVSVRKA